MDIVTLALAKKGAKQYTDTAINNLPKGVVYRGSVNYFKDLPNNAEIGECYSVLYDGETGTKPLGVEYVWGLNTATSTEEWIAFGPDLSDYVKFTNYATANTGGVIKIGSYGGDIDNSGKIRCNVYDYTVYPNVSNNAFISKGTLENVITGKGLVSNTDYANSNTGGVIKVSTPIGTDINEAGVVYATSINYNSYSSASNNLFVSKGTLENVITGKDLTTKSYVDGLVGDVGTLVDAINGEVI